MFHWGRRAGQIEYGPRLIPTDLRSLRTCYLNPDTAATSDVPDSAVEAAIQQEGAPHYAHMDFHKHMRTYDVEHDDTLKESVQTLRLAVDLRSPETVAKLERLRRRRLIENVFYSVLIMMMVEQLDAAGSELTKHELALRRASDEKTEAMNRADSLAREKSDRKKEFLRVRDEARELKMSLYNANQAALEAKQQAAAELRRTMAQNAEAAARASAELDTEIEKSKGLEAYLQRLKEHVKSLEQRLEEQGKERTASSAEASKLAKELAAAKLKNGQLEAAAKTHAAEVETLTTQLTMSKIQVSATGEESERRTRQLQDQWKKEVQTHQKASQSLQAEVKALKEKLLQAEAKVLEMEEALAETIHQGQLEQVKLREDAEKAETSARVAAAKAANAERRQRESDKALRTASASHDKRWREMLDRMAELEKRPPLREKEIEVSQLERRITGLEEELTELRTRSSQERENARVIMAEKDAQLRELEVQVQDATTRQPSIKRFTPLQPQEASPEPQRVEPGTQIATSRIPTYYQRTANRGETTTMVWRDVPSAAVEGVACSLLGIPGEDEIAQILLTLAHGARDEEEAWQLRDDCEASISFTPRKASTSLEERKKQWGAEQTGTEFTGRSWLFCGIPQATIELCGTLPCVFGVTFNPAVRPSDQGCGRAITTEERQAYEETLAVFTTFFAGWGARVGHLKGVFRQMREAIDSDPRALATVLRETKANYIDQLNRARTDAQFRFGGTVSEELQFLVAAVHRAPFQRFRMMAFVTEILHTCIACAEVPETSPTSRMSMPERFEYLQRIFIVAILNGTSYNESALSVNATSKETRQRLGATATIAEWGGGGTPQRLPPGYAFSHRTEPPSYASSQMAPPSSLHAYSPAPAPSTSKPRNSGRTRGTKRRATDLC